jgi:hypothetical protein
LNEARHTLNLSGAGTITHLAPEMFEAGSKVTTAVDSYAFGERRGACLGGRMVV